MTPKPPRKDLLTEFIRRRVTNHPTSNTPFNDIFCGNVSEREGERYVRAIQDNDSPPTKLINVWFRAKSISLFSSTHTLPARNSHALSNMFYYCYCSRKSIRGALQPNKIIIYKWNYLAARYTHSHTLARPFLRNWNYETSLSALEDFLIYSAFRIFSFSHITYSYHLCLANCTRFQ